MPKEMEYEANLLAKLVAIDTNSSQKKNYEKCANFIANEAKKLGLKAKILNAHAPDGKPRPNVLIELQKGAKETMLLLAHYDIVDAGEGWKTNPFNLVRKGNKLFGRGTNDDKGAVAAAFGALKELKEKKCGRNIKLIVACDEEVGGEFGVKFLCDKHKKEIKADFALSIDSDTKYISGGCSGPIWFEINLKGKAGHAAYPHKTPNVVHAAIPFLNELLEYKKIRERKRSVLSAQKDAPFRKVWGRFSITMLNAGYKTNVIPPSLKIGGDIRAVPEEDAEKVRKEFLAFLKNKMKKYKLKGEITASSSSGYISPRNNKFIRGVISAAGKASGKKLQIYGQFGAEDGRWLAHIGMPTVAFGPGGKNLHAPGEYITFRDLKVTKKTIINLAISRT
jgi:acetylornithine deacetylase/succinyl-diaminopimelate desuccinylase family protein